MSEEKDKKLTYAMTQDSAIKQITESNRLFNMAKYLLETYLCGENDLKYKDNVIECLAEYMTNTKFFSGIIERCLFSDNIVKNKKTGEDNIVVSHEDFALITTYLTVTAACENDLESYGVSMRLH